MGDGASEFSDWEVLSAASSSEGDDDGVLISGECGGVLLDHFALVPGFSAEGSWPEIVSDGEAAAASAAAAEEEEGRVGLELLQRCNSISRERMDLIAVMDSSGQLELGGADDETAAAEEGAVLEAAVACGGATWSAEERHHEALRGEMDHHESVHRCAELGGADDETAAAEEGAVLEAAMACGGATWSAEEAVHRCAESGSIPQAVQGPEEILDFDATAAAIEISQNCSVQLEDGGDDANTESSPLEATATSDVITQSAHEEEPEQGKCTSDVSSCGESDGEGKDGSSPVVESPISGKREGRLVVWWRLPFRLLHYCAWKVKPVWSISIAAALLGLVVVGRRMYRLRRKTRGILQINITFDDKRASQFADRATRLNEAFFIARRVPALRTSSGAALPWSMMQER